MALIGIYRRLSVFVPRPMLKKVSALLEQGGMQGVDSRSFAGFALFFSFGASVLVFFLEPFFFVDWLYLTLLPPLSFFTCLILFYTWLTSSADSRARRIEEILPIAMQMISANIRAGMTLESAVWGTARPEFGPFKDEIEKMSADSFGGASITEAFADMTRRVNSQLVERAIRLINEGIVLGGEMARLLDQVAFDIRSYQLLQKEIAVATTTYGIFIVFASVVAAPLLFSVSTYYAVLNEQIAAKQYKIPANATTGGPQAQSMSGLGGIGSGGIANSIKSEDIRNFAMACIIISTFFASLILGLMREGKASRGLKYVPVFAIIGLGIFFLFSMVLQSAFSSIVH